jgi:hypothetical protein
MGRLTVVLKIRIWGARKGHIGRLENLKNMSLMLVSRGAPTDA